MNRKIFCIGLSRTGTTSLCEALKTLDYKTVHFPIELYAHPEIITKEVTFKPQRKLNPYRSWTLKKELKALNQKFNPDILNEYDAFGDLPIPLYYKELDKKFEGSKFIYTYRNEKKWLESMKWLFKEGAVLWSHGELNRELNRAAYGTTKYDEQKLLEEYRDHHENVLKYFTGRQDDLLLLNIDEQKVSFDTLCSFLKIKVPNVEFPKSNSNRNVSREQHINFWLGNNIPFYSLTKRKLRVK